MKLQEKLIGYYNYTVILTYIGMICGFAGIALTTQGEYCHAMICLMVAGLCDMFDGAIASTMKRTNREKSFGIQIDSLSDLICFGVLPGVFVFSFTDGTVISFIISALYVLCALIRLAYFNVDELERQQGTTDRRELYLGLPVTSAALIIPAAYELATLVNIHTDYALPIALFATAILFVTPFKLKKAHLFGMGLMLVGGIAEFVILLCMGGVR